MEREGATALLPAPLSETPRSEGPKKYIRNAEAEGSNPFTSTKGQVTGLKWDPEDHQAPWSATWLCVEVVTRTRLPQPKTQIKGVKLATHCLRTKFRWCRVPLHN
jgi:hypothetical protein